MMSGRTLLSACAIAALSALSSPAAAYAQATPPDAARTEIAIGALWSAPIHFANADAVEHDRSGDPYRLFTARGQLRPAFGLAVRAARRVHGALQVEVAASYSVPRLSVAVSSDVEDAESISITERVTQIQVEGGIVAPFGWIHLGARTLPFVTAGAGYLRELHEGQTLGVTGRSYFAGGGLKHVFTADAASGTTGNATGTTMGLRIDARIVLRTNAVALDDHRHLAPVFGASLFLRF